jgi:DNA-binding NtrC family response regulator
MGSPMADTQLTEDQIADARILIVDDDELVTGSLSSFFALELDVDPIIFNQSRKAAEHIEKNELDLIITDFLMPEMNGIELLRVAREHQPHVPRVLLTGYADKENAIKAINEVGVFQYIEKPWENDRLKRVVVNALTRLQAVRDLSTSEIDLAELDNDFVVLREALLSTLK